MSADAVALAAGDEQLSYACCEAAESALAALIAAAEAPAPHRLAPRLVAVLDADALLAVLVARTAAVRGLATVVPLEAAQPSARLRQLCGLARVGVLVTGERGAELAHAVAGDALRVLVVTPPLLLRADRVRPSWPLGPPAADSVAHVYFTSGSTGRPKGVIAARSAVAAYARGKNACHGVDELDSAVVMLGSGASFDPWLADIVASDERRLRLVVPVDGGLGLVANLARLAARFDVTHVCTTPALIRSLLDSQTAFPPALRCLAVGGSRLSEDEARVLHQQSSRLDVLNTYGVTEAVAYQTVYALCRDKVVTDAIGRDLDGMQSHVSGDGELLLAGPQLALGYAYAGAQTAAAFLPTEDGMRMYATGDLVSPARRLLGRRDAQIKINGVRIDVAEIEYVLATRLPTIVSAAVVHLPPTTGRLTAHVQVRDAALCDDSALLGAVHVCVRRVARTWLPGPMQPVDIVYAPSLARLPGGASKIDRTAVVGAFSRAAVFQPAVQEPLETEMEHLLAMLWMRAVRGPVVSATADFFTSGGDSLAALRVSHFLHTIFVLDRALVTADMVVNKLSNEQRTIDAGKEHFTFFHQGTVDGPHTPANLMRYPVLRDLAAHLEASGFTMDRARLSEDERADLARVTAASRSLLGAKRARGGDDGERRVRQAAARDKHAIESERYADDLVEALQTAAAAGHAELVRAVLAAGAHPDGTQRARERHYAPLHVAAARGHIDVLRVLLDAGAMTTVTNTLRNMPSHYAAQFHLAAFVVLLEHGAPLAARNANAQTYLHCAARVGHDAVVRHMLALIDGARAALAAAGMDVTSERALAEFGKDHADLRPQLAVLSLLNATDRWHRTALSWAVLNGHTSTVGLLLAAGAVAAPPPPPLRVLKKSTRLVWESPLHLAARVHGREHAITAQLLAAGADASVRDGAGRLPFGE